MATASVTSRPPAPSKLYDLDITIVNAKHLKNVNWRQGDLRPYVIFWVDPDRRLATKPDDSGTTRPVWNERFVLPLSLPPRDSLLTLEIFHSRPSETSKPLVGTLRIELRDVLVDSNESATRVKSFELKRPSGRPHGKIRLKLSLRERPNDNYQTAPPSSYMYSTAPPPPLPTYPGRDYRGYSPAPYSSLPVVHQPPSMSSPPPPPAPQSFSYTTYSDPYSGYYPGYYSQVPPPPPPRPFFDRQSSYGGPGPSAPVDYAPYDHQKRGSGKFGMGMGTGLAVGAVAGALGGLALEEGIKYEEEKIADRVENDLTSRDDHYSDYHTDY
ncbi:Calcium-dependent lipid-binding (CaLB domain) family protein [Forsythia ovata]|uniref:Calcium-dependent lipid-binding (CaLB domain) family protein n=1 Tax=Forsythia ovata TaxID=205694 RepID=A0ABD1X447_9LAMI